MKNIAYLILALATALCGCSRESDLKKSIFIPDPDDANLPSYTEWGYNTFGAYINRDIFIYSDSQIPLQISVKGNTTVFQLVGKTGDFLTSKTSTSLSFQVTNVAPTSPEGLDVLNKKVFQLTDPAVEVYLEQNGRRSKLAIRTGTLIFERVQRVTIDRKYSQMILSGYFDISATLNGGLISISDGRFDVGIRDGYNFYYQPI